MAIVLVVSSVSRLSLPQSIIGMRRVGDEGEREYARKRIRHSCASRKGERPELRCTLRACTESFLNGTSLVRLCFLPPRQLKVGDRRVPRV